MKVKVKKINMDDFLEKAISLMLEDLGKELEKEFQNAPDINPSPKAAEKFYATLNKKYNADFLDKSIRL